MISHADQDAEPSAPVPGADDSADGADAAEDTPPPEAHAPGTPRGRARRRAPIIALGLAVVVIVGLGIALAMQIGRTDDLQATIDQREEVATTAGRAGEALLTYDYQDIDGSLERVQSYTGGEFSETFAEIFNTVQVPVITQLQARATADVQFVYVSDIDGEGVVRAVVVLNQTVQSTAGTRRLTNAYLQMDLVQRGDRWVIESVPVNISAQGESLTPPAGEAPTG